MSAFTNHRFHIPTSPSGIAVLSILLIALLAVGCGGDDDTTGPGTLGLSGFRDGLSAVQGPVAYNGHTYYRLANSNWSRAEMAAVRQFGGHLVKIDNAAEDQFVRDTFARGIGSTGRVWIGLTDAGIEGEFVWSDGSPLVYTQWEPGEPNNRDDEDYVGMYANNGNWVDLKDLSDIPLIGKLYGVVEVDTAAPVYVVQGPIENPANGHTYYRLSNSNWSTAAAYAVEALGGQLVKIDDAAENTFVLQTFANAPGAGRVWIGLSDAASEGTFAWTDGTATQYTNWEPGEPNNSNDEDYVAMYSGNGRWVDAKDLANAPGIGNIYGVVEVR